MFCRIRTGVVSACDKHIVYIITRNNCYCATKGLALYLPFIREGAINHLWIVQIR